MEGKIFSFSVVSTYKLTKTEYSETVLFSVFNDQSSGEEVKYDVSGKTSSAPVKVEGKRIQFKAPFDPPVLVFDGNKMTATAENQFVDTWKKVQ